MLTKNFYNFMMAHLTNVQIENGYVHIDGTVSAAKRVSSVSGYLWNKMNNFAIGSIPTSYAAAGVRIGTGVTPATADDYTLESVITSGLTYVNPGSVAVTKENGFVAVYATYTVTNTDTTAVSISEIGLFCGPEAMASVKPILMDRTVLEYPIVVNPGEAKPITYTIRFNYPTE